MSLLPRRSYTQLVTETRFCRPSIEVSSLLLNFLTGLPHFLINALADSLCLTSLRPHRKLSADVTDVMENVINVSHKSENFFIGCPIRA